jgi:hypothetical protein
MTNVEIPALRGDLLGTTVPERTYAGGEIADEERTLFLWRAQRTELAKNGTLAFFLSDDRLEALWRAPERYTAQFVRCGIGSLIEADFSLWVNESYEAQRRNVFRQRSLARQWQEAGLLVAPCLNWSNAGSFSFAFQGVPVGCPLVYVECRTPGGNDADRRAFLAGLGEAVRQLRPGHIVVYGGREHEFWLRDRLPTGPAYTLLTSWTTERRAVRAEQARREEEKYQPSFFGGDVWVDVEQVCA